jgi:hypothetical protein
MNKFIVAVLVLATTTTTGIVAVTILVAQDAQAQTLCEVPTQPGKGARVSHCDSTETSGGQTFDCKNNLVRTPSGNEHFNAECHPRR